MFSMPSFDYPFQDQQKYHHPHASQQGSILERCLCSLMSTVRYQQYTQETAIRYCDIIKILRSKIEIFASKKLIPRILRVAVESLRGGKILTHQKLKKKHNPRCSPESTNITVHCTYKTHNYTPKGQPALSGPRRSQWINLYVEQVALTVVYG